MVQERARKLIKKAVENGASDLYLIPRTDRYHIFERCHEERTLIGECSEEESQALIGHFKFMAGMNVGEKRRSQQGSCDYDYGDGQVSIRLSSVGDYRNQESLVIRLMADGNKSLHYWFSGLEKVFRGVSGRGLYLFSGPVGSGKTSLMYHLAQMKFQDKQVMTIEDPVEIKREDMLQLQLNEAIGATYDNLIKLSLRHRPDLLIIGEIRDTETARAVIRASLTGATVFSTVHAKSISGVYARLLELGIREEELKNALKGITYQRLIKGKGLVDYAQRNFQLHNPIEWNQQVDALFEAGHLTKEQVETEKITDFTPA